MAATSRETKSNYANWVSSRLVILPGVLGVLLGVLILASPWFAVPALLLLATSGYFAYARWQFSARGGDVQSRIQALALRQLEWDGAGQVLDIGCGNGPLSIAIARAYPQARVTGIDSWGASWEYSKRVCEANAAIEGVAHAVTFQQASAVALPFGDEAFDVVVSNLVFHEVHNVRNKADLVQEALRVLRKGGRFVFQDLFLWKQIYGRPGALLADIRSWGVEHVELLPTHDSDFIPRPLKLPFMVGTLAILHGKK